MSKPVVAITRPKDRAKKACEIVEKLGGVPILAPTLDFEPVNSESLKNLVRISFIRISLKVLTAGWQSSETRPGSLLKKTA